ncbi:MAG: hypothetical protein B6D56_05040 [Candidatus Omnitrophica bacterium 4484_70.1]|nr:MAG: hypothetical protein B6D56_05040 [Candidatus Omnitrophica bacterium 4484_70.1]
MGEIRDPIYGFIELSEGELKIINTSLFQRLRKIKQLAMAYLVYPCANHTRFDHSLGVYHLSALLHDVGHGPFSHVSEELLEKYASIPTNEREKIHEKITAKLIENNTELKNLLSVDDRKSIVGLLSGTKVDVSLMRGIVSGPLDADKMDYLLRDSYFCGVNMGFLTFIGCLILLIFMKKGMIDIWLLTMMV